MRIVARCSALPKENPTPFFESFQVFMLIPPLALQAVAISGRTSTKAQTKR